MRISNAAWKRSGVLCSVLRARQTRSVFNQQLTDKVEGGCTVDLGGCSSMHQKDRMIRGSSVKYMTYILSYMQAVWPI